MKPVDNIQDFVYVPAFVDFSFTPVFGNVLRTPYGLVVSNEIINADDLMGGEAVLTSFTVNHDKQTSTEFTFAYNLGYVIINRGTAQATPGGASTGDFDLPIENVELFGWVGYNLFFGFFHNDKDATKDDKFFYEMTYESGEPIVYIRARKGGTGVPACSFNMLSFFTTLPKDDNNKVRFKIKFKTGEDEEGDQYGSFNLGNDVVFEIGEY